MRVAQLRLKNADSPLHRFERQHSPVRLAMSQAAGDPRVDQQTYRLESATPLAQAYMLISMPTSSSTTFGVFHFMSLLLERMTAVVDLAFLQSGGSPYSPTASGLTVQ